MYIVYIFVYFRMCTVLEDYLSSLKNKKIIYDRDLHGIYFLLYDLYLIQALRFCKSERAKGSDVLLEIYFCFSKRRILYRQ